MQGVMKSIAIVMLGMVAVTPADAAHADDNSGPAPSQATEPGDVAAPARGEPSGILAPEDWSFHFQTTGIYQGYPAFHSPFQGANSLPGGGQVRETITGTAFLGRRLPWDGGELYINPEFNQGFGLARTLGVAAYPNGEAQKAGFETPKPNVARLFLRQTFGLGGEQETLEPQANQLGGKIDIARITVTAGKMAIPDLFDNNTYSHDPRRQFMNWALMDAGAYDYAADQKGYTDGIAVELNQKSWALRGGYFLVPKISNSRDLETRIAKFGGYNVELEMRYDLAAQPGTFRVTGFANRIFAGSFRETLANPAFGTDIALDRKERLRYGFVLNAEQAVNDDLGLFSRFSWNDGKYEYMSFTDIAQSFSLGMSLQGARWRRPNDTVGLAAIVNTLSRGERAFLAAGGTGILIGDGRLDYAPEGVVEAYYNYRLAEPMSLTLDYQFVANPAYNRDRGPVHVFAARAHVEF